jgi:hypothetical protein
MKLKPLVEKRVTISSDMYANGRASSLRSYWMWVQISPCSPNFNASLETFSKVWYLEDKKKMAL